MTEDTTTTGTLSPEALVVLLDHTAETAAGQLVPGTPGDRALVTDALTTTTYELAGLAVRIRAADRRVNGTPVKHPTRPLPQPRQDPKPKDPPPREEPTDRLEGFGSPAAYRDAHFKPTGYDDEGFPQYQTMELDRRFDALLGRFMARKRDGEPHPAWIDVERAYTAITDPENLDLAGEAVDVLDRLVNRAEDRRDWLAGDLPICQLCGDILDDTDGELAAHFTSRHRTDRVLVERGNHGAQPHPTVDEDDEDDLTAEQRAHVARYLATDGRRDNAVITVSERGPVTIGDLDMRVSRIELATMDLARAVGPTIAGTVSGWLFPVEDAPQGRASGQGTAREQA